MFKVESGTVVVFTPGDEQLVAVVCVAVNKDVAVRIVDALNLQLAERAIDGEY